MSQESYNYLWFVIIIMNNIQRRKINNIVKKHGSLIQEVFDWKY
jgi:hypothetical protein